MMLEQLIQSLKRQFGFPDEAITAFQNAFVKRTYKKGEFILNEGQVCRNNNFISEGLAMYYQLHDGNIIPCDFAAEGQWANYIKSYTTGEPSDMIIVALEPTTIHQLSKEKAERLMLEFPQVLHVQTYFVQKSFIENTQHTTNLAKLNGKERYLQLLENHPDWIQRVPQYYIAGYLGIKPQSLSRIKKELSLR